MILRCDGEVVMTGPFDFVSNPARDASMSDFEYSLTQLSALDIAPMKEKELINRRRVIFNVFRYGLLILFIGIFVYCAYLIGVEVSSYMRADDLYSDLANQYASDDFIHFTESDMPLLSVGSPSPPLPNFEERLAGVTPEQSETATGGALARAKVQRLQEMNPDAVGWINIPGTGIEYPVVQAEDNEYYLDYDFNGQKNFTGSIFMECRNSETISENLNTVVYGHNMEGGVMFNRLTRFLDEDFFYDNRYIYVDSNEGTCVFEIFSVFKANEKDNYYYTFFNSNRDFVDFCYEMKYKSVFPVDDIEFEEDDRIITLSTCTNENQKERYAVQGKLIRIEK
ncbi:MAG: class B sortase [Clostridiales bacterium]|nr:class B sortase [Clostridiales bacterium]